MIKSKNLEYFEEYIKHSFFNSEGGFSTGDFKSLNVSYKVGDNPLMVEKNIAKIASILGIESQDMIFINQTHSNNVIILEDINQKNLAQIEADAIITQLKNKALNIVTADCAPILLYETKSKIIGVIHAGWRGALNGVIENTIKKIKSITKDPDLYVAIGPCIKQSSYEVDENFYQLFLSKNKDYKQFFHPDELKKNQHYFDITSFICNIFIKENINNVEALKLDTYKKENNFFSHRRATKLKQNSRGLNCSSIIIKK